MPNGVKNAFQSKQWKTCDIFSELENFNQEVLLLVSNTFRLVSFKPQFEIVYLIFKISKEREGGKGEKPPPPEAEKIVAENWCYFQRLYF